MQELFKTGQEQRICFAPVQTMEQLSADKHLEAREFFVEVPHPQAGTVRQLGAPYRLREPWWKVRRPAPTLGEHNAVILAQLGYQDTDLVKFAKEDII